MSKIETADYDAIKVGDSASVTKTVTESDVILFAGITGDFNPLHTNEEFAKTTQFGKRLVHGCFSSGLISRALGMKLPGPGALYVSQTSNYKKPVFIGDTLTAKVIVKKKFLKKNGELKFLVLESQVFNQNNQIVTDGEATMIVM